MGCACGIYAAKSLDQLRQMGYYGRGIYGAVSLWGKIVEHGLGWRAQYAYPKNLVLSLESVGLGRFVECDLEIKKELEARVEALTPYGVDISMDNGTEPIRLWAKNLGYDSAGLDWLREVCTRSAMAPVQIAILMEGRDPQVLIQNGVEVAHTNEIAFTEVRFPLTATNPIVRQIQDERARVVVIDLGHESLQCSIHAVAIIRRIAGHIAILVTGDLSNPNHIVTMTQAGAHGIVDRNGRYDLLDAVRSARTRLGARWTGGSMPPGRSSPPGGSTPPTAPVYAPWRGGPRPMPPREVALAV